MTVYAPGAAMAGGKSMRRPGPTVIGRVDEIGPFTGGSGGVILPTLALNTAVAIVSNSLDGTDGPRSVFAWTMAQVEGRYYFNPYANQSRNGAETGQYLLFLPNALGTAPGVVIIGDPGNDFVDAIALAVTQANIQSLTTQILATGARVIIRNCAAGSAITGAAELVRVAYNAWLPGFVAGVAGQGVYLDDQAAITDNTDPLKSYDGQHPTAYGALIRGGSTAAILNGLSAGGSIMAQVDAANDTMFGANLNTVTAANGTAGTVTGWAVGSTNYTGGSATLGAANVGTSSLLAPDSPGGQTLRGEKAQQMNITGGPTNNQNVDVDLLRTVTVALLPHDFTECLANIKATATDGISAPVEMGSFQLATGNTGRGRIFDKTVAGNNGTMQVPWDLVLRTNPWTVASTASSTNAQFELRFINGNTPDIRILQSGLRLRFAERRAYAAPRDQSIPGDAGFPGTGAGVTLLHYLAAAASPASGAAGAVFTTNPGNVSGGGWYSNSPVPGSVTYQWKKASDNTNVSTGTGFATPAWTSSGTSAGNYYCAITWTHTRDGNVESITVNSNNITVT